MQFLIDKGNGGNLEWAIGRYHRPYTGRLLPKLDGRLTHPFTHSTSVTSLPGGQCAIDSWTWTVQPVQWYACFTKGRGPGKKKRNMFDY